MDPFSAEGELAPLHNAFHTGQYATAVAADIASLSPENQLPARVLQLRSRIALGEASAVAAELDGEDDTDLQAVRLYAQLRAGDDADDAEAQMRALVAAQGDNLTVQLLGATVLANRGDIADALSLLSQHQGSLDAVALIVQLHLAQNRLDLATQEVRKARGWAQDSLLVNIAESWVGLREGGTDRYQSAFYVFEELATAPPAAATADPTAPLVSQSLAELHLGRLPEADAAVAAALARDPPGPSHSHALAAAVPLYTLLGRAADAAAARKRLEALDPAHPLVAAVAARDAAFDAAAARYKPVLA